MDSFKELFFTRENLVPFILGVSSIVLAIVLGIIITINLDYVPPEESQPTTQVTEIAEPTANIANAE